jgi:hypothetical protein
MTDPVFKVPAWDGKSRDVGLVWRQPPAGCDGGDMDSAAKPRAETAAIAKTATTTGWLSLGGATI